MFAASGSVDLTRMTGIVSQFGNLERMLDAAQMRHRVIGQNIANVNTPGYHRHDVDFEQYLKSEMNRASGETISTRPSIVVDDVSLERADGNNVDIDHEIGELNRNAMLYETWLQIMAGRLNTMQHAIRG